MKIKERMAELDGKGEDKLLSDEEVEELHSLTNDFYSLSRINTSICWQKSRV